MNRNIMNGLFVLCLCLFTLTGCELLKPYNTSSLEYLAPPSLKMGRHNIDGASMAYQERILNKIDSVAKKHSYERMECKEVLRVGKETDFSCYRQKDKEKYVTVSYDARMDYFVIMIIWSGAPKDPSILEVKADFERELTRFLGSPVIY